MIIYIELNDIFMYFLAVVIYFDFMIKRIEIKCCLALNLFVYDVKLKKKINIDFKLVDFHWKSVHCVSRV